MNNQHHKQHRLGDLQLRIMQVLWARGASTVQKVQAELNAGDEFAYTTIATMLRKMEDRGLVRHETAGRRFVYQAAVEESEVTRTMATDMLERLFEGSLADMVHHLLDNRDVSADELARIEKMIVQRKKKKT
ncbi:MAG: BlaI/MecI/CopY family transcriptional regulator [Pirellulales bacterium]|nr:BlaI/MecI/CopY family transcriptional regulator [Pirellulales bacterium]